jgi:uncharacterized membrane protein YeaQ/YmgE (transglycosylase-associated protein family)
MGISRRGGSKAVILSRATPPAVPPGPLPTPPRTRHDARVRATDAQLNDAKEIRMHWLWVFLIGLVVGLVAKLLMPGKDPGGFIITAIIGIAGSLLATWVGQNVFGWYQEGQSAGFIASVIGAIVLLLIYHLLRRKSA